MGKLNISNSIFENNSAKDNGGAIVNDYSIVTIFNSSFINNEAPWAGAIRNDHIMTIINCSFINNIARLISRSYGYGGAIYNNGDLNITNTSFLNNTATSVSPRGGGAIINFYGRLNLINSTFLNNTAIKGSSIYNDGELFLENNTMKSIRNEEIYNNKKINSLIILTILNNDTINATYNNKIKLNVTITDDNGNNIVGQNIILNESTLGVIILENYTNGIYYQNFIPKKLGLFLINGTYNGGSNIIVKKGVLNVSSSSPILEVNDIIMYYRNGTRLIVFLRDPDGNPLNNMNITIYLNNVSYNRITNASGQTSLAINLAPNTYDVLTLFNAYENYSSIEYESTIEVKSTIYGEDMTKYYLNDTHYYASLLDNKGNPLINTSIIMNINGVFYNRSTDSNGIVKLNINLNPNNNPYIITVYNPINNQSYSNEIKVLSTIYGEDITKYFLNDTHYYASLIDYEGKPIVNQSVLMNINGVFYNRSTDSNGIVKLNINLNPNDNPYIITVYNPINNQSYSNEIKVLHTLFGQDLNKSFLENKAYEIVVLDERGNPLGNQNISININGVVYFRVTDSEGIARLNINLNSGTYIATATWNECRYSNIINVFSFDIQETYEIGNIDEKGIIYEYSDFENLNEEKNINNEYSLENPSSNFSYFVCNDFVKYCRNETQFHARLFDSNSNPIPYHEIHIKINGMTYERETDENGSIKFNINLNPNLYYIQLVNIEDNATITKYITVLSNILSNDLVKYYKNASQFQARLIDGYGEPLRYQEITMNINGVFYNRTTNSEGIVILNINLYPGKYLLTLEHPLNGLKMSNQIHVISTLIAYNMTKLFNENKSYEIKVLDDIGQPLSNQIITINLNGVLYNRTTDTNGIARLNINLNYGTYVVTTTWNDYSISNIIRVVDFDYHLYINQVGGFYNLSNLTIVITSKVSNNPIFYSLDNETWYNKISNVSLNLYNGIWDLYYYDAYNIIQYAKYIIDNNPPISWANYESNLYNDPIIVNLSAIDDTDDNPIIYYSINDTFQIYNSTYSNSIFISTTTYLKFYSIDKYGHTSNITTMYYIYDKIANLNTGKTYNSIQEAIDDSSTLNGHTIKINSGNYNENIILNKEISLIGTNSTLYSNITSKSLLNITSNNCTIIGINFERNNYGASSIHIKESINNIIIFNCTFINNSLSIMISSNVKYINILYNEFYNCDFAINGYGDSLIISNNIFENCLKTVHFFNIENSLIFNNHFEIKNERYDNTNGLQISMGSNNIIKNNSFVDYQYGILLSSSENKIISNYFEGNFYGFYSTSNGYNEFNFNFFAPYSRYNVCNDNGILNISNNWWGDNNPLYFKIRNYGEIILDKWIVLMADISSYHIVGGIIEKAVLSMDMLHNNKGEKLYNFIPNNINVSFRYGHFNNYKWAYATLTDNFASVYVDLKDSYDVEGKLTVDNVVNDFRVITSLSKNASATFIISSTAVNTNTGERIDIYDKFPLINATSWFSVIWRQTGLYNAAIDIIIDGNIVSTTNIINSNYSYYKNNYSENVFKAINNFNVLFASEDENTFKPNFYLQELYKMFPFLEFLSIEEIKVVYLSHLKDLYNLTDNDINFIIHNADFFVDRILIELNYGGDLSPNIIINDGNKVNNFNFPGNTAIRISNIYYTDLEYEEGKSAGFEGMRSFAIATTNVNNNVLNFWTQQKNNYEDGKMKAAYGTFLTALLVIYNHDQIADQSSEKYNVKWDRISPVCVSFCNDYNSAYITGEMDHGMGMTVEGDPDNIWMFRFVCSFSFSLVEELVGNNVHNNTYIGSITLGFIESFMNNESLEIFYSNEYMILKLVNNNNDFLILDLNTGIIRDIRGGGFLNLPCYHKEITDGTVAYSEKLIEGNNFETDSLESLGNYSIAFGGVIGSALAVGTGKGIVLGGLASNPLGWIILGGIVAIIAFECSRPHLADLFDYLGRSDLAEYYRNNNILDMGRDLIFYAIFGELNNVPVEVKVTYIIGIMNSPLRYIFIGNSLLKLIKGDQAGVKLEENIRKWAPYIVVPGSLTPLFFIIYLRLTENQHNIYKNPSDTYVSNFNLFNESKIRINNKSIFINHTNNEVVVINQTIT